MLSGAIPHGTIAPRPDRATGASERFLTGAPATMSRGGIAPRPLMTQEPPCASSQDARQKEEERPSAPTAGVAATVEPLSLGHHSDQQTAGTTPCPSPPREFLRLKPLNLGQQTSGTTPSPSPPWKFLRLKPVGYRAARQAERQAALQKAEVRRSITTKRPASKCPGYKGISEDASPLDLGEYRIVKKTRVTTRVSTDSAHKVILSRGTRVKVIKIQRWNDRVRARLEDPVGWISLYSTDSQRSWTWAVREAQEASKEVVKNLDQAKNAFEDQAQLKQDAKNRLKKEAEAAKKLLRLQAEEETARKAAEERAHLEEAGARKVAEEASKEAVENLDQAETAIPPKGRKRKLKQDATGRVGKEAEAAKEWFRPQAEEDTARTAEEKARLEEAGAAEKAMEEANKLERLKAEQEERISREAEEAAALKEQAPETNLNEAVAEPPAKKARRAKKKDKKQDTPTLQPLRVGDRVYHRDWDETCTVVMVCHGVEPPSVRVSLPDGREVDTEVRLLAREDLVGECVHAVLKEKGSCYTTEGMRTDLLKNGKYKRIGALKAGILVQKLGVDAKDECGLLYAKCLVQGGDVAPGQEVWVRSKKLEDLFTEEAEASYAVEYRAGCSTDMSNRPQAALEMLTGEGPAAQEALAFLQATHVEMGRLAASALAERSSAEGPEEEDPKEVAICPRKRNRRPSPQVVPTEGFVERAVDFWKFVAQAFYGARGTDNVCTAFCLGGSVDCLGDVQFVRDEITGPFLRADFDVASMVWHCLLICWLGAGGPEQKTYQWLRDAKLARPYDATNQEDVHLIYESVKARVSELGKHDRVFFGDGRSVKFRLDENRQGERVLQAWFEAVPCIVEAVKGGASTPKELDGVLRSIYYIGDLTAKEMYILLHYACPALADTTRYIPVGGGALDGADLVLLGEPNPDCTATAEVNENATAVRLDGGVPANSHQDPGSEAEAIAGAKKKKNQKQRGAGQSISRTTESKVEALQRISDMREWAMRCIPGFRDSCLEYQQSAPHRGDPFRDCRVIRSELFDLADVEVMLCYYKNYRKLKARFGDQPVPFKANPRGWTKRYTP